MANKPAQGAAGRSGTKSTTKRVMLNTANDCDAAQPRKCSYCDKEHDTDKCYAFKRLSAADRWRVVTERAWCFGCLTEGHMLPSCDERRKCAVDGCEYWHHVMLHDRGTGERTSGTKTAGESAGARPRYEADTQKRRGRRDPGRAQPNAQSRASVTRTNSQQTTSSDVQRYIQCPRRYVR